MASSPFILLRHALYEAARAGSTQAADPQLMRRVFLEALPLSLRQRVMWQDAWRIQVLSPTPESHADFAQRDLAIAPYPVIRHDFQARQHAAKLAQGWPQGRGPRSQQTIFEANTLHLALSYPYRTWLPWLPPISIRIEARLNMQSHARDWRNHSAW